MKVAFDVHGVLDALPEYRALMRTLYHANHEIYIISGQPLDAEIKELLVEHNLDGFYDEYRSVETYLLAQGNTDYEIRDGQKFWADEHWDHIKAQICEEEYIDMIFDNSPSYAETFKSVRTEFALVIDKTKTLANRR